MKLLLENWNTFLNEAHGLSQKDLDYVRDFAAETDDKELKRILKFIVKSNVLVDISVRSSSICGRSDSTSLFSSINLIAAISNNSDIDLPLHQVLNRPQKLGDTVIVLGILSSFWLSLFLLMEILLKGKHI